MVGVLAAGGKVLDELAELGYMVPELPLWVGPNLEEKAEGGSKKADPALQPPEVVLETLETPPGMLDAGLNPKTYLPMDQGDLWACQLAQAPLRVT